MKRALITVSDKTGIAELAQALHLAGVEIIATGKTATVIKDAGVPVTPIESVSGSPEAFQGRMKTLSFPVCSGILYRRGDASDEADLAKLKIKPIDCVVVNFYPFEAAAARPGVERRALIDEIDIGGPTLVRAAAKNSPDVLVLTHPNQYARVIQELKAGRVSEQTAETYALDAWTRILEYDQAIAQVFCPGSTPAKLTLRYGENPHQMGSLEVEDDPPLAWPRSAEESLTPAELSYNNILDLSAAYALASDLKEMNPGASGVVIVKHNNPCGVALVPRTYESAQKQALLRAWEGDPISAFGGVLVFTDPISSEVASWLSEKFVELVSAPDLKKDSPELKTLLNKRKNIKAVTVKRWSEFPKKTAVSVPGGILRQSADLGIAEDFKSVTSKPFGADKKALALFGVAVTRALKSNAIAIVREIADLKGAFQLVGAGQGQPNRVEALARLAVPRAQAVLRDSTGGLKDCVMVSDAFFPFRDTVDQAQISGIRYIVQPGGSIKDAESISACNEHGVAMAFTGIRHFRH